MNASWFLAFAGFAALIVLHEFGHFLAAKASGMRVERFFLFFPPKLVSIKRGETEYGIGAIPLGGFVKITGMNPEEEIAVDRPAAARSGVGSRAVAASADDRKAEEPQVQTVPASEYPRSYYHQPVWKRIVVIAAGPAMNVLIAFAILFFLAFGAFQGSQSVGEVESGYPAAGKLKPGDEVVAVDGRAFAGEGLEERLAGFGERVASHECPGRQTDGCRAATRAEITVQRDGQRHTFRIPPQFDAEADRARLGFSYAAEPLAPGAAGAAAWSASRMWDVTSRTMGILARIFKAEQRQQLSGVVGGYEITRQSFEFDMRQALLVLAIISLSLAIINMFPFLPLDGGHILWSVVEKIRGRRVPFSVMERAGVVGFALVLMLFAIGLSNDIGRLTGEGFDVR